MEPSRVGGKSIPVGGRTRIKRKTSPPNVNQMSPPLGPEGGAERRGYIHGAYWEYWIGRSSDRQFPSQVLFRWLLFALDRRRQCDLEEANGETRKAGGGVLCVRTGSPPRSVLDIDPGIKAFDGGRARHRSLSVHPGHMSAKVRERLFEWGFLGAGRECWVGSRMGPACRRFRIRGGGGGSGGVSCPTGSDGTRVREGFGGHPPIFIGSGPRAFERSRGQAGNAGGTRIAALPIHPPRIPVL